MSSDVRRLVLLIWLCFVARGAFYVVLLPLWEGYDEWAHFAYVQLVASGDGLPVLGRTHVSREVAESRNLTPLAAGDLNIAPPRLTHDDWWRLPPAERDARRNRLYSLPPEWASQLTPEPVFNYEAQQPPLYYLLVTPVQLAFGEASLPTRVLLARLESLLITSLVIPLVFFIGRRVFGSDALAAGAAAVVASMPGFLMTASRAGNDGLAAVVFAALLWAVTSGARPLVVGALLGAGLLTKAYFLTAIPAVVVVYSRRWVLSRDREGAVALLTAGAIAGWWYWRNHVLTGTWSGLQQVAARNDISLWSLLGQVPQTDWLRFFDVAFLSHIWSGNWSFLQVRGWMYRPFAIVVLIAFVGLVLHFWRDRQARPVLVTLAAFYGFFWLGLCYHEQTFAMLGLSSGAGWYVSAVVAAEALLATLGLAALLPERRRGWVPPLGAAMFALLDLYATHFLLLPYYTGLIAHRADGPVASFHLTQLGGGGLGLMASRLMAPAAAAVILWLLFLAATLCLPVLAAWTARRKLS